VLIFCIFFGSFNIAVIDREFFPLNCLDDGKKGI